MTLLSDVLDAMSKTILSPSASCFSSSFQNHTESKKIISQQLERAVDGLYSHFIWSSGKKRRSVATHALPIAFQEEHGGDSSFAAELAREIWSFSDGAKSFSSHLRAVIVTILRAAQNQLRSKTFWSHSDKVVKSVNNKRERKTKRRETLPKGESLRSETKSMSNHDEEEANMSFFDVPHSAIKLRH